MIEATRFLFSIVLTRAHQNHEDVVTSAFDGLTAETSGSGGRNLCFQQYTER